MQFPEIEKTIGDYLAGQEIACGALTIRKNDEIVFDRQWGYSNLSTRQPLTPDSLFRMMSMTKCVTAVAIVRLAEKGLLSIDAPLSDYLPEFRSRKVVDDKRYSAGKKPQLLDALWKLVTFRIQNVKTTDSHREITIRDLLSHASGLEQGWVGYLMSFKNKTADPSLDHRIQKYASYPLDFQPGTATGYSPLAAFDVLVKVMEVVTGKNSPSVYRDEVFLPLGMSETTFFPDDSQRQRLVRLYRRQREKLVDVTGTNQDVGAVTRTGDRFISGSGGLYSTLRDYEKFTRMLCNDGLHDGVPFLTKETVEAIRTEAQTNHLEPEPGNVWGLGVKIRQNPALSHNPATPGTYGWSGAFGTHFFISPKDHLDVVWVTNRSDIGGSDSPVSKTIERLVFEALSKEAEE